jgi:hypothetical protein
MKQTSKDYNLVGSWALVWKDNKLLCKLFIYGKADESHYIVQALGAITGDPNICKVFHVSEMKDWVFAPTKEIAEEILDDYYTTKKNRYKFPAVA